MGLHRGRFLRQQHCTHKLCSAFSGAIYPFYARLFLSQDTSPAAGESIFLNVTYDLQEVVKQLYFYTSNGNACVDQFHRHDFVLRTYVSFSRPKLDVPIDAAAVRAQNVGNWTTAYHSTYGRCFSLILSRVRN